jgi:hypothetical protein
MLKTLVGGQSSAWSRASFVVEIRDQQESVGIHNVGFISLGSVLRILMVVPSHPDQQGPLVKDFFLTGDDQYFHIVWGHSNFVG